MARCGPGKNNIRNNLARENCSGSARVSRAVVYRVILKKSDCLPACLSVGLDMPVSHGALSIISC